MGNTMLDPISADKVIDKLRKELSLVKENYQTQATELELARSENDRLQQGWNNATQQALENTDAYLDVVRDLKLSQSREHQLILSDCKLDNVIVNDVNVLELIKAPLHKRIARWFTGFTVRKQFDAEENERGF